MRLIRIGTRGGWFLLTSVPASFLYRLRGDRRLAYRALGEGAAKMAESLGPVFVKMGQMLSYRHDLFPSAFLEPLAYLRDSATPEPLARTMLTLREAFGADLSHTFKEFDTSPIGVGSVAMVFRGKTIDGRDVAVKVVRREARRLIHLDTNGMCYFIRWIERLPVLNQMPVSETVGHILHVICAQTDMHAEAANLSNLIAGHRAEVRVSFPHPIGDLTSRNVLVMQHIAGKRSFDDPTISADHYKAATKRVLNVLYRMLFNTGVVHCDMHPGNILIGLSDHISMVDGGLVARLDGGSRACFRDFFLALSYGEIDRCVDGFLRAALEVPRDLDRKGLEMDVATLVHRYHGVKAGAFLVAEFVFDVFKIQKKYALYVGPAFASAIWALVVYEGLVRSRAPELDFQEAARPFIVTSILDSLRKSLG